MQPVTLITGTRKGIGRYLVEHYTRQGHLVVGCSRGQFEGTVDNYEHFCLDVSDDAAIKLMMNAIRKRYGRLDHLINNAGIASMNHFLLTPAETIVRIYHTNVLGTLLCCREAAKLMKEHMFGRIVNFATAATPLKLEGEAVYASSKAAIVSLTEILARELADFGITVNAIGPTPLETDLTRSVPKDKLQQIINRQAIRRFSSFDDIGNVIDFFLKRESDFVTGQVIYLGGL
jgi:3-oxoacyl-[acyl-carrier protein] reductase